MACDQTPTDPAFINNIPVPTDTTNTNNKNNNEKNNNFIVTDKLAEISPERTFAGGVVKCVFTPSEDEAWMKDEKYTDSLSKRFIVYGVEESVKSTAYDWKRVPEGDKEEALQPGIILEHTYKVPSEGKGRSYRCFGFIYEKTDEKSSSSSNRVSFYSKSVAFAWNSAPEDFKTSISKLDTPIRKAICKGETTDKDAGDKVSYRFAWEKSQSLSAPVLPGLISTLSFSSAPLAPGSSEFTDSISLNKDLVGRYLRCKIVATDGKNMTTSVSDPLYIENNPPVNYSSELKFLNKTTSSFVDDGYVGDTVKCEGGTSDPEGGALKYKYGFYYGDLESFKVNNDENKLKNLSLLGSLPFSFVSSAGGSYYKVYEGILNEMVIKSDYREMPMFCISIATDEKGLSTISNASIDKILKNRAPIFPDNYKPTISNSNFLKMGDKLYCTAGGFNDLDGDEIKYNIKWQASTYEIKESLENAPNILEAYSPSRALASGSFETIGEDGPFKEVAAETDGSLKIVPALKRRAIRCIVNAEDVRKDDNKLESDFVYSKQIVVRNSTPSFAFEVKTPKVKVGQTFSCGIIKNDDDGDSYNYSAAVYYSGDNITFTKLNHTASSSDDTVSFNIPVGSQYSHKYLKCKGDLVESAFQNNIGNPIKLYNETASFIIENTPPANFAASLEFKGLDESDFSNITNGKKLKVGDSLRCNGTTSDADDDSPIVYKYNYEFSYDRKTYYPINSLLDYKLNDPSSKALDITAMLAGSYLRCYVSADDGNGGQTNSAASSIHTLENSLPKFDENPYLKFGNKKVDETDSCEFSYSDIDRNEVTYKIEFLYKNAINDVNDALISSSSDSREIKIPSLVAHKYIACRVTLYDGEGGIKSLTSDFQFVPNSTPYFETNKSLVRTESDGSQIKLEEKIYCQGTGKDKDQDSIVYKKALFKTILNDAAKTVIEKEVNLQQGEIYPYTKANNAGLGLPDNLSLSHARISCVLRAEDQESYVESSLSDEVQMENKNPSSPTVSVINKDSNDVSVNVGDTVVCDHGEATDPDGDTVIYSYIWYYLTESAQGDESKIRTVSNNSKEYLVQSQESHGFVYCKLVTKDEYNGESVGLISDKKYIENMPSFIKKISLLSSNTEKNKYVINDTLTCIADAEDLDGDRTEQSLIKYSFYRGTWVSVNNTYVWETNPIQGPGANTYTVVADNEDYLKSPTHNYIKCKATVTDSWDNNSSSSKDSMDQMVIVEDSRYLTGVNSSPSSFQTYSYSRLISSDSDESLYVKDESEDPQTYFECRGSTTDIDSAKEPITYSYKYQECSAIDCGPNSSFWYDFTPVTLSGSDINADTIYYKKSYILNTFNSSSAPYEGHQRIAIGKNQAHKNIRCIMKAIDDFGLETIGRASSYIEVRNSTPKICVNDKEKLVGGTSSLDSGSAARASQACLTYVSDRIYTMPEATVSGSYPNKVYTETLIEEKIYAYDRDGDAIVIECQNSNECISNASQIAPYLKELTGGEKNTLDVRGTSYYKTLYFKPGINFANKTTNNNQFTINLIAKDSIQSTSNFYSTTNPPTTLKFNVKNTDRDTVLTLSGCYSSSSITNLSVGSNSGLKAAYQVTESVTDGTAIDTPQGLRASYCNFSASDPDGDSFQIALNQNTATGSDFIPSIYKFGTVSDNASISINGTNSATSSCSRYGCLSTSTTSLNGVMYFKFTQFSHNFKGCFNENGSLTTDSYGTCNGNKKWRNMLVDQGWTNASNPNNFITNLNQATSTTVASVRPVNALDNNKVYSVLNSDPSKPCPNSPNSKYCFLKFIMPSIYLSDNSTESLLKIGFLIEDIDSIPFWDSTLSVVSAGGQSYTWDNYKMNGRDPTGLFDYDFSTLTDRNNYMKANQDGSGERATFNDTDNCRGSGWEDGTGTRDFNYYSFSNGVRVDSKIRRTNTWCGCISPAGSIGEYMTSRYKYYNPSPSFPNNCASESQNNYCQSDSSWSGWSGSYAYDSCTVQNPTTYTTLYNVVNGFPYPRDAYWDRWWFTTRDYVTDTAHSGYTYLTYNFDLRSYVVCGNFTLNYGTNWSQGYIKYRADDYINFTVYKKSNNYWYNIGVYEYKAWESWPNVSQSAYQDLYGEFVVVGTACNIRITSVDTWRYGYAGFNMQIGSLTK